MGAGITSESTNVFAASVMDNRRFLKKHLERAHTGACKLKGGGRRRKNSPQEAKKIFLTATLVPPQHRIQKFLPVGNFFYHNPPLSPLGPQTPPPEPPPGCPPPPWPAQPHPNPLAPPPPQNFFGGCPGYHGQAWPIRCPRSWGRLTERRVPSTTAPTVRWIVHMYMYTSTLMFLHHRSLKEKRLRPRLNVQKRGRELHPSALRRTRHLHAQRL